MSNLIFVDTEGANPTHGGWTLREFGAVHYDTMTTFYGKDSSRDTFTAFDKWLSSFGKEQKVFITDNIAYDWPPIHFYLMLYIGRNQFGHSARRIGDFYAGLTGDFRNSSKWKKLRVTPHDHNPVHDALGNAEAFRRIMKGERA